MKYICESSSRGTLDKKQFYGNTSIAIWFSETYFLQVYTELNTKYDIRIILILKTIF